eukprot:SM000059S18643  [mRNA]  locus=s59:161919:164252:+ [translate_table: standard]
MRQGHAHPKIVAALVEQAQRCTLSSRAFHNERLPTFARLVHSVFGYDMMLPMNTGAEGVETALKLARKWGYEKKGIPEDQLLMVSCCGCFHGRTLGAISMSCDNDATRGFWPLVPGNVKVDFGDIDALRKVFREQGKYVAGFLFEPIQGEAGTGIARTGRMLACEREDVHPDVVILGKALGGGVVPVSLVMSSRDIMLCIQPGEHGSTFGGNPLACAVGTAALEVVLEERLAERADVLGEELRADLREIQARYPKIIKEIRGRGLLNAIVMNYSGSKGITALDVCLGLKERGILAKPTQETVIRLAPPLTISRENLKEATDALKAVLEHDMPEILRKSADRPPPAPPQPCDRCGRVKLHMPETDL